MKKVLVTGSLGTIGRPLTAELKARGFQVFGCDLFHAENEHAWSVHNADPGTYFRCDVREFRQCERMLSTIGDVDFIYHTAAEFGRWNGEDFYENLWQTNVIGTRNMIELQRISPRIKLVHFSSSEVYGDYDDVMSEGVPDVFPISLLNDYAMTKRVNEMQLKNAEDRFDVRNVIVRLFNTYGPGERYSPYRSVNCRFIYHALRQIPITVHRGHSRTSTYVDDTVRTLANITGNFIPGSVYNIAGFEEHTMEDLAALVIRLSGKSCPINVLNSEPMTTMRKEPDSSLAVRELNHVCQVGLEEGNRRTMEWMRGQL